MNWHFSINYFKKKPWEKPEFKKIDRANFKSTFEESLQEKFLQDEKPIRLDSANIGLVCT